MTTLTATMDGIGWVPKRFELTPDDLDFSEGRIPLTEVEDVVMLSSDSGREFSVRVPGRNYLIRATNANQAREWVAAIAENVRLRRSGDATFSRTPLGSKSTNALMGSQTGTPADGDAG